MKNVKLFNVDVVQFRNDFEANGPMVPGLPPYEANERLRRFWRPRSAHAGLRNRIVVSLLRLQSWLQLRVLDCEILPCFFECFLFFLFTK